MLELIIGIYGKIDKKYNVKKYIPIISYLFWGVVTTLVNILVYTILTKKLNIDYMVSNVISWIIAVLVAYITNKSYVFKTKTNKKRTLIIELCKFFSVRIFSLIMEIIIMFLGVSLLGFDDVIVKIITQIVVIISNYFMSKFIVFTKTS